MNHKNTNNVSQNQGDLIIAQLSEELKTKELNVKDWSETLLLIQHEPIRQDLQKLIQFYTFNYLKLKERRQSLYFWFKNHLSQLIDLHEHLEEQMWSILKQKQEFTQLKLFDQSNEHVQLESLLEELVSHLEQLSSKDEIKEQDLDSKKVRYISGVLLQRLNDQEVHLLPILKDNLTQRDVFDLFENIFQKNTISYLENLFPWILNGFQKWASQNVKDYFQQMIENSGNQQMKQWIDNYSIKQKKYSLMLTDSELGNNDLEEINLLHQNQNIGENKEIVKQGVETKVEIQQIKNEEIIEEIIGIYSYLYPDEESQGKVKAKNLSKKEKKLLQQLVLDAVKIGMTPISFFFQNLDLKGQTMVILSFVKENGQEKATPDDQHVLSTYQARLKTNFINNQSELKLYQILDQFQKENSHQLSPTIQKAIKKVIKKFRKIKAVTCAQKVNQKLESAERFRVEGVDDTYYGIFLALYLLGLIKDLEVPVRIGSGLVALYLTTVNYKCMKLRFLNFKQIFSSLTYIKNFFTSFLTLEGIKSHDYKKFIEDYAFIGMDVTFALKAFGLIDDVVIILSGAITQSMMVLSALIEIVQRKAFIEDYKKINPVLKNIMAKREELPPYMQGTCLSSADARNLEKLYDEQIIVQKKEIKILPIFAIFEFGLVFFGLVALLNIDLKNQVLEFIGPFLVAVCVLTTQITKKIVEKKIKDEEIYSMNHTQLNQVIDCLKQ